MSVEDLVFSGISPFIDRINRRDPKAWDERKKNIVDYLKNIVSLNEESPIRVKKDEVGWGLFLCEQMINDPYCIDVSQLARVAPFFAGIGARWEYSCRVKGINEKIDEIVLKSKEDPDGKLFEILVALSYASMGWDVEFLKEYPPNKSPDIVARKEGKELYIECKRMQRQSDYSVKERIKFLNLWKHARNALNIGGQWVWFKGDFFNPMESYERTFIANSIKKLPKNISREIVLHEDESARILARPIDVDLVRKHLSKNYVKNNSPALMKLLGGDWVSLDEGVTLMLDADYVARSACNIPLLDAYVDDIKWACGFTRNLCSPESIKSKARNFKKLLVDAIKQLPDGKDSVVHIAAETLDGSEVERFRTTQVFDMLSTFNTHGKIGAVMFHRFQSHLSIERLWDFDETVDKFNTNNFVLSEIPSRVVVPNEEEMREGWHWM